MGVMRAVAASAALLAGGTAAWGQGQPSGSVQESQGSDASSPGFAYSLDVSGKIIGGILATDDGARRDLYLVDNDNSSSRLTIVGRADRSDEGLSLGFRLEGELQINASNVVSQTDKSDTPDPLVNDRIWEVFASHPAYGTLTLGKGSTASDGVSEIDLSGTGIAGYSSTGDLAGGLRLRDRDGGDLTGAALGGFYSSLDGLGRQARVRYDTPTVGGVALALSFDDQRARAAALTMERDLDAFAMAGVTLSTGIAWSEDEDDETLVNGSLSLLHEPSGWNLTLAAARGSERGGDDRDPRLRYVKLGWKSDDLFALGTSAVSLDYARNEDIGRDGDGGRAIGAQFVQTVERYSLDLYAGYRRYDADRDGASFEDADAILAGLNYRF